MTGAAEGQPTTGPRADVRAVSGAAEVLIGIDMGTGSSKGVLTTPDGTILARATRPRLNSMLLPRPNWAEVDAEETWWGDVCVLARELSEQAGQARIAGICVSGAGPCLVLADADDVPVRPAILYGIDMRAGVEIIELTERFGAQEIFARCGKALSTQAVGPKIAWVQRHEPEVFARAVRFFGSSSFIARRLSGAYVLDHQTASQFDPLYDISARDWYAPWAEQVVGQLEMPRLVWPSEVIGVVSEQAAAETGLPVGTPVCAGTVDAWAEAFSAGVRAPGDLMLMYGSTMFFVQVMDDLASHPQLWTTAGVDEGSYTLAAGMSTSGSLTSWMQDLVGGVPFAELIAEAAQVPAGSDGLLLLPYFAGERTPVFDARARGWWPGSASGTPGHTCSGPSTRGSPTASGRSWSCWTPT